MQASPVRGMPTGLSADHPSFHKPTMTGSSPSSAPRPGATEAAKAPVRPEVASMPFERAIEELEGIVQRLEQGNVALDESVAIYERGEALKRHCEALLQRAEARIQKITLGPDGAPAGTAPLDPT
jgi:exodeoxyribonuclease VII small subunit